MGVIYKNGTYYGGGSGGGGATYTAGDGINIDENNEISTNNMSAEDMSEVASPMPSVMSRRFKYSTEEQIVGEWIDGKPLYQKSYILLSETAISNTTWTSVGISESGIKTILSAFGNANYSGSGNKTMCGALIPMYTGSEIKFLASRDGEVIEVKYITLQYTKTTD